jgi:UDP-3-O-[3-hydroxymyristoyl] glucosamine N-acyltransferase
MKSSVREVLGFLGLNEPVGRDFPLVRASPPTDVSDGTLTLVTRKAESLPGLFRNAAADVLVFAHSSLREQSKPLPQVFLFSDNPRLMFCRALNHFLSEPFVPQIADSAVIRTSKPLNRLVRIGAGCVISGDVTIGDRTEIEPLVTISGKVTIGCEVYIKSGTVIGQKGFGFERDDKGTPVLFPQLGGVRIGNRVEVGALNTIARGALGDTVVSDDVKTDDHVHIAHNVQIGPRCLITAGAVIAGSVRIGSDVWIGPNATTTIDIEIRRGAQISLGAVVVRNVKPGQRVSGNFAEPHEKFLERYLTITLPRELNQSESH